MNAKPRTTARLITCLLLTVTATAWDARAATRFWTGASATSGNWTTAANWQGGVAPSPGDGLQFSDAGARKTSNTNNFPAGTRFTFINCFGNGYRLRGNRVTLTNSMTVGNPAGSHIVDLDITLDPLDGTATLTSFDAAANLTINGDINLGSHRLLTDGAGDITIAGVISGTGSVFKNNAGTLSFAGFGPNSYSGLTTVARGVLRLSRYLIIGGGLVTVGTTAIAGDLAIGDFASTLIGDIAVLDRDNQIANTSTVFVNATGSLELSDESDTVGELRLRGGTVTTGTGSLGVEGGIYATLPASVSKDSLIAGRLTLGTRGDEPQLIDVASGAQLNITAQISGVSTADLIKTNRGDLFLTESNLFSGDVEIKGGIVTITDGHALGTTNGVTRLMGGRLHLAPPASMGIPEHLEVVGLSVSDNELFLSSGNGASWLGNIRLDHNLLFNVVTNAALSVVGQISGPAGWLKFGPGTLQFKTPYTNTYAGQSQVNHGTFIMDGVFNQPVVPGDLFISPVVNGAARASAIKHNQIADTASVIIFENGRLDLFGVNDTIGELRLLDGGAVETGAGTLTLNGDIRSERQPSAVEPSSISGNLSLGGATRTINTVGTANMPNLEISAVISDGGAAAGFNKIGESSLELSGANIFSGPVSVTDGTLRVAHPNALGSSAAGTTVSGTNGAKIILEGGIGMTIAAEPLTLNSTGPGSPVALENFTGNNQWNGPITLLAPQNTINVPSPPRPLALGGAIIGPGGLKKVGAGNLTLNGNPTNTFTGLTFVAEGELILNKPTSEAIPGDLTIGDGIGGANADRVRVINGDEIWNGSRVIINSSGQLILDSLLELVGSIEGNGNILLQNATSGLIVGRNDLSTSFDGVISGAGGFEKVGAGTLVLTANHTYTGASGATEGTLVVNGSIASSLHVQVNRPLIVVTNTPFGILAGTGFVPTIFPYPGGTVSPGTSPGRLTVQGNADLANSDLRIELNGTVPGVSYDQLRVTGNVNLNHTKLFFFTGFPPTTNDTFLILDKTSPGPIAGFFLNTTEGSVMGTGFNKYRITYQGGDGNDVVLRRVEIPGSNITGILAATAEKMQITGQGVPFVTYILEATPTLNAPIPWTPIATNTANALGIYEFIDAYADGGMNLYPARFYRVQSP
jgi:autotransporter-associated beta strand protein